MERLRDNLTSYELEYLSVIADNKARGVSKQPLRIKDVEESNKQKRRWTGFRNASRKLLLAAREKMQGNNI